MNCIRLCLRVTCTNQCFDILKFHFSFDVTIFRLSYTFIFLWSPCVIMAQGLNLSLCGYYCNMTLCSFILSVLVAISLKGQPPKKVTSGKGWHTTFAMRHVGWLGMKGGPAFSSTLEAFAVSTTNKPGTKQRQIRRQHQDSESVQRGGLGLPHQWSL